MPRKIRALIKDLKKGGWYLVPGGKGDHRKFQHASKPGSVIIPHGDNEDAAPYLEKQIREALSRDGPKGKRNA
jgi:predicted RNA binding protein YcfA (HicA-like mRNA interferase family)